MRAERIVSTFDQVGQSMVSSMVSATMAARQHRIAEAEERDARKVGTVAVVARAMAADRRELARLKAEVAEWRTRALRAEGELTRQSKVRRAA